MEVANVLHEQWRVQIMKDARTERNLNVLRPSYILNQEDRIIVWDVCLLLDVLDHGVPGEACRFVEFFLADKYRRTVAANWSNELRRDYQRRLFRHLHEIIVGAVLISTMLYHTRNLSAEIAHNMLVQGGYFTMELHSIIRAKFEILTTHNFKLPLWSSLQMAEILALKLGLPFTSLSLIGGAINTAELWRHVATRDMVARLRLKTTLGPTQILTIHLAAAAVYSVVKRLRYHHTATLPTLAYVTNAPTIYIDTLSSLIDYYTENENQMLV